LFVQNEEQADSNLWTKTATTINRDEYAHAIEERRQDVIINEWNKKIKNREITMADVPEHLLLEIRARI
jgi:hypothetical protein